MAPISQTIAEHRVKAYLHTLFAEHLAQAERGLGIEAIALDAGWVFLYHLTRAGTVDPRDRILGAPAYFVDKQTGTIYQWGRNTDFWLQGRVYEALHNFNPRLPWPQIFVYSDPERDHLTINLRPNQTLCRRTLADGTSVRAYSELGEFDRTCVACTMAADGIGPWCWNCGRRLLVNTKNYCDECEQSKPKTD